MDTFEPLVTIIIPVYNGQDFLADAIDSALSQSYNNTEVIVVNDGSTDLTEMIARSYGDKIRYFYKPNGGVASALNFAIRQAKGDYISWLSHDDLYFTEKIKQQVKVLRNLRDRNSVIFSDWVQFSFSTETLHMRYRDLLSCTEWKLLEKLNVCRVNCRNMGCVGDQKVFRFSMISLLFDGLVNGCTLLIPKELFGKVGYFNEELLTTQDYDMWFRFIRNNVDFVFTSNYVVKSRQHKKQGTVALALKCKKEERLLFKKAGVIFFSLIVRMNSTTFQPIKRRLRGTKNRLLLFCILFFRYLARIFDTVKGRIRMMRF